MIRDHGDPAASRVRNLNHLWGRLTDFYQVRIWEREAEPGAPTGRPVSSPLSVPSGGAAAADPVGTPRPSGTGV